MDVSVGDSRNSRCRDVDFDLCGIRVGQRPSLKRSRLQRDCRLARGDPRQFNASGRDLHGSAHGETMVPGKDPLRVQFAGTPELRVLSARRPNDLSRPNAGCASHLRRAEASHFCVRVPGTSIVSQVGGWFSRARETVVQHGNLDPRRLRYFVIGDTSAADIDSLARLFKAAS